MKIDEILKHSADVYYLKKRKWVNHNWSTLSYQTRLNCDLISYNVLIFILYSSALCFRISSIFMPISSIVDSRQPPDQSLVVESQHSLGSLFFSWRFFLNFSIFFNVGFYFWPRFYNVVLGMTFFSIPIYFFQFLFGLLFTFSFWTFYFPFQFFFVFYSFFLNIFFFNSFFFNPSFFNFYFDFYLPFPLGLFYFFFLFFFF